MAWWPSGGSFGHDDRSVLPRTVLAGAKLQASVFFGGPAHLCSAGSVPRRRARAPRLCAAVVRRDVPRPAQSVGCRSLVRLHVPIHTHHVPKHTRPHPPQVYKEKEGMGLILKDEMVGQGVVSLKKVRGAAVQRYAAVYARAGAFASWWLGRAG